MESVNIRHKLHQILHPCGHFFLQMQRIEFSKIYIYIYWPASNNTHVTLHDFHQSLQAWSVIIVAIHEATKNEFSN